MTLILGSPNGGWCLKGSTPCRKIDRWRLRVVKRQDEKKGILYKTLVFTIRIGKGLPADNKKTSWKQNYCSQWFELWPSATQPLINFLTGGFVPTSLSIPTSVFLGLVCCSEKPHAIDHQTTQHIDQIQMIKIDSSKSRKSHRIRAWQVYRVYEWTISESIELLLPPHQSFHLVAWIP